MSKSLIFAHFLSFGEQRERFAHDRSFPLSDVRESLSITCSNRRVDGLFFISEKSTREKNVLYTLSIQYWFNNSEANSALGLPGWCVGLGFQCSFLRPPPPPPPTGERGGGLNSLSLPSLRS